MAGASMQGIKNRIKSVSGTMQITKAMELVATSKLRGAREAVERTRPYTAALLESIDRVYSYAGGTDGDIWLKSSEGSPLYIVIAGDRGLAGGYNSNAFKLALQMAVKDTDPWFLPIGKKACEFFRRRGFRIWGEGADSVSELGIGRLMRMADKIVSDFKGGIISEVNVIYTEFTSVMVQNPRHLKLLPLKGMSEAAKPDEPIIDGDIGEILDKIIPQYVGGFLHSAVCESLASECGARRIAMNSANKNAEEMIDTLMLKYNRARQAVITQEITEIVSGAEAL